jgi:hypothetical protein
MRLTRRHHCRNCVTGTGRDSKNPAGVVERAVPDYLSSSALAQGQVVSLHGAAVPGATVLLFPVTFAVKPGTVMTPLSRAPGGRRKAHPALRTSTQSAHDLQPPCICGRCLRKAAKPLVDNVGRGGRPWGGAAG